MLTLIGGIIGIGVSYLLSHLIGALPLLGEGFEDTSGRRDIHLDISFATVMISSAHPGDGGSHQRPGAGLSRFALQSRGSAALRIVVSYQFSVFSSQLGRNDQCSPLSSAE